MVNTKEVLNTNGLRLSVDWLSWTIQFEGDTEEEQETIKLMIKKLGYSMNDFEECKCGGNGYAKRMKTSSGFSVLYAGNKGMGVHFDASGAVIGDLLEHFSKTVETYKVDDTFDIMSIFDDENMMKQMFDCIVTSKGKLSRLDIAVDDIGCNFFSVSDLMYAMESDCYCMKFKQWMETCSFGVNNAPAGKTVYLGKQTSDIMMRIYDKQLEQNQKIQSTGKTPIDTPWVRWEMQMRRQHAQSVACEIAKGKDFSEIALGILSHYFRIIKKDNERKSRCTMDEKWERFIDGVKELKICQEKKVLTIAQTKDYLYRQCSRSFARVIEADAGDTAFLFDMLKEGKRRFTETDKLLIQEELKKYKQAS